MYWTNLCVSTRKVILPAAVLCLAAIGLIAGAQFNSADASTSATAATLFAAPAATFAGTNTGGIPDGPAAQCGTAGAARDVMFNVTGLTGAPTNVEIDMTFGAPAHSWRGDVAATLIAPNGASHTVFGRTGATTATACGSSTDLTGPYLFNDTGLTTWWTVATNPTPPGTYRTTTAGGSAAGGTVTSMTPAFTGVANPNGTWLLRLTDAGGGDTGGISAATLTVDGGSTGPADAPVDLDGDGSTNYVVVRNTGGGPSGQITWFYNTMGGGTVAFEWGLATDFFVSEDFDGDGEDDIAVWRPVTGSASFYIHNSATNTARVEEFGLPGDDPTVVGDYNNDGSADLAVYRAGATPGAQSTWYYRTSPGGPVAFVPWGQNGDFPAPGDYDGDGSADFVIQRNDGGGAARFWRRFANGTVDSVQFGTPTDVVVPGDYDGDGSTDIATLRGIAGQIHWFYEPSSIAGVQVVQNVWGNSATDFPTQGDYNGDGRTDLGIWRPSATPGASAFWTYSIAGSAALAVPFGQNGDYPVANFNVH